MYGMIKSFEEYEVDYDLNRVQEISSVVLPELNLAQVKLRILQERTQELLQITEIQELRQTIQPEERAGDCITSLLSQ